MLPAGTLNLDCTSHIVIKRDVVVQGQGFGTTVIRDACPDGDTIVIQSADATVTLENLRITRAAPATAGSGLHWIGNSTSWYNAPDAGRLFLRKLWVDMSYNCIVAEGRSAILFIEQSIVEHCVNDGGQFSTWASTLHDNWFQFNGGNGVSFLDGFPQSSTGNEFYFNGGHGVYYKNPSGGNAWHVGDYIDSNRASGLYAEGLTTFVFNDGWIGSNGIAKGTWDDGINNSLPGIEVYGVSYATTFNGNMITNNHGPGVVMKNMNQVRAVGNNSAYNLGGCDSINGSCFNLNAQ